MSQVKCEHCGTANPEHEAYCYSCGHILPAGKGQISTNALPDEPLTPQIRWGTAYFGDKTQLRIRVRDQNALVEVGFENELVIGRTHEDEVPDVDLSSYNAKALGVSRQHVKLTRETATVMVQDLGSKNGTFLNGQKLMPYQPRVLRNEDELRLGRLALRISFCRAPDNCG